MDPVKRFKWTVEIEVSENWVADGFNATSERMDDIMRRALPYSSGSEVSARVVKAPSPESIAIAQGAYKRLGWFRIAGTAGKWHQAISVEGFTGSRYLCDKPKPEFGILEAMRSATHDRHMCPECKRMDES